MTTPTWPSLHAKVPECRPAHRWNDDVYNGMAAMNWLALNHTDTALRAITAFACGSAPNIDAALRAAVDGVSKEMA